MKEFDRIKNKIVSVCRGEPAVVAAYVFGSFAKGRAGIHSDLDVAVLLKQGEDKANFLLGFIAALEKILGRQVDVVLLNHADELLKFEVRKHGKLVFTRSEEACKRFEVMGRKTYEDFLYLHKRYVNSVLYGEGDGQSGPA